MLHLLPIRWILIVAFAIVGLSVLGTVSTGWLGAGDPARDAAVLLRASSFAATAAIILLFAGWRWESPIQKFICPYLGGRWSGSIRFADENGEHSRDVNLEIKHTLFGLRLLLDSKESTSSTLVVHAERDPHFERYRLYYVYLNERKEGVPNPRQRYRGLAILRVEQGKKRKLIGDYFTEFHKRGTLHLSQDSKHPWWKLWR